MLILFLILVLRESHNNKNKIVHYLAWRGLHKVFGRTVKILSATIAREQQQQQQQQQLHWEQRKFDWHMLDTLWHTPGGCLLDVQTEREKKGPYSLSYSLFYSLLFSLWPSLWLPPCPSHSPSHFHILRVKKESEIEYERAEKFRSRKRECEGKRERQWGQKGEAVRGIGSGKGEVVMWSGVYYSWLILLQ